jgi:2'-5' RNA ligase
VRLFVALEVTEEVRERIREVMPDLRKHCPGARWVRPEGIHVTLKFIGQVEAAQAEAIQEALRTIGSDQPVEMQFQGWGFFPNQRRPRVLWCGVQASPNLAKLAADIENALEALAIPKQSQRFVPHLTLARIEEGKVRRDGIDQLVNAVNGLETASFGLTQQRQFHLYQSLTKPSGAEYRRLESFPFLKGTA